MASYLTEEIEVEWREGEVDEGARSIPIVRGIGREGGDPRGYLREVRFVRAIDFFERETFSE